MKLTENVEKKILEVVKKYEKTENELLNYVINDDTITFFTSINNGKEITAEDLEKIAEILNGSFEGIQLVNQEYRFTYKLSDDCKC